MPHSDSSSTHWSRSQVLAYLRDHYDVSRETCEKLDHYGFVD